MVVVVVVVVVNHGEEPRLEELEPEAVIEEELAPAPAPQEGLREPLPFVPLRGTSARLHPPIRWRNQHTLLCLIEGNS